MGDHKSAGRTSQDPNPTKDNIRAVAELERVALSQRTLGARLSDAITNVAGSQWSLALHAAWFGGWLLLNSGLLSIRPFDPYPFSLLTSVVSLEAIFLTLFVLASQNRMARETDKRSHLDLQVNLLAEQEMTMVLGMLHELCNHFRLTATTQSEKFRALSAVTDVSRLADEVEQNLQPDPGEQR
jgi:uncharacterized membrane protein